jgi:hypothetical protein
MANRKGYLEPYRQAVRERGVGFDALLWRSEDAQRARFDALARAADPSGRVIADLGSGLADFALRLRDLGREPARYLAVEAVPELAARAAETARGLPFPAESIELDFAGAADAFETLVRDRGATGLYFSGSLNTFKQREAERVIARAWDALTSHAGGGAVLAFNFLSDRNHGTRKGPTGPARRFDTHRLVGVALDRTPLVRFDQTYLDGHDATIAMTVPGPRAR